MTLCHLEEKEAGDAGVEKNCGLEAYSPCTLGSSHLKCERDLEGTWAPLYL